MERRIPASSNTIFGDRIAAGGTFSDFDTMHLVIHRAHYFRPAHALQMDLRWIEIRRDDAAFDRFLGEVLWMFARPDPPPGAKVCPYCAYHAATVEVDPMYRHDGLPF